MSPIFIHSLWRSGSTYIFNVFRRSGGFWTYQEPIHEVVLMNIEQPDGLLQITGEVSKSLKHPELSLPYFYELHAIYPAWKNVITKKIIYDEYFASECSDELKNYIQTLTDNAQGRTVIQECRTSCRIRAIKNDIGGFHVYLWRNPWDQWWSFKINDYFDKALLMVLNAENPPVIIQMLLKEIDFLPFHDENIVKEFDYFDKSRLSAKQSYSVFYTIWFLGLLEGIEFAHTCINIDALSKSDEYKTEVLDTLIDFGIESLDFSDCDVYQSFFADNDEQFFIEIENEMHALMISSGISLQKIESILQIRQKYKPDIAAAKVQEDLKRMREIVFRTESEYSIRIKPIRFEMYSQHLFFESPLISCYSLRGFNLKESWGVWSSGKNASFKIDLKEMEINSVNIRIKFGMKIFEALAHYSPVVKITFGNNQTQYILFRHSKQYIGDIELNFLSNGINSEILFECTHEDSPLNHGSADSRILSFGIDNFSAEIIELHESTLISEEILFLGIQ